MKNAISIYDLTISIANVNVVDHISFSLQEGQTLALVGESGSGKTLTALAIMQLLPYAASISNQSEIVFANKNLLNLSEIQMRKIRGRRIGLIFQEAMTALNPVFTIYEQIDEVLKCHFKMKKAQRYQRILQLLNEVGIEDCVHCAKSYIHQLSGGMRQRAMIAMTLAAEPELLIADEPTTALDVSLQAQILSLLKTLQEKRKMSLLFITHDLSMAAQIADHIIVLHQGKIVESKESEVFFKNPQHEYSKELLAATLHYQFGKTLIRPQPMPQPLMSIEHLKVYFSSTKPFFVRAKKDIKAVDDVSFTIKPGQTFALVGESGSGKTTVARAILQLTSMTAGRVVFQGDNLAQLSKRALREMRKNMQVIFQDPYSSMNPRMMVGEILKEGLLAQNIGHNEDERQIAMNEMLARVGLSSDCQCRYPHEFSGGQRQRICIARALVMRPKLVICDEPTSALDVIVQMQILRLLRELQQELGLSYLLITHNIAVVGFLAHEVGVMHQGKIVEQGDVEQVLFNPQHDYTQRLLADVPD